MPADDQTPIGVEDIRRMEPQVPEPDERARLEIAQYDHQFRTKLVETGWIGKLVGCNAEKPGNISFIVIFVSLFFIGSTVVWFKEEFETVVKIFSSLITLALGYLFGSQNNK